MAIKRRALLRQVFDPCTTDGTARDKLNNLLSTNTSLAPSFPFTDTVHTYQEISLKLQITLNYTLQIYRPYSCNINTSSDT